MTQTEHETLLPTLIKAWIIHRLNSENLTNVTNEKLTIKGQLSIVYLNCRSTDFLSQQRKFCDEILMTFSTIRVSLNRRLILIVSKLFSVSSESTSRDKNSHVVAPRVELNRIKCVNRSMSGNKMRQKFHALRKKLRKILLDYDKRRRRRSSNTMSCSLSTSRQCLALVIKPTDKLWQCVNHILTMLSRDVVLLTFKSIFVILPAFGERNTCRCGNDKEKNMIKLVSLVLPPNR